MKLAANTLDTKYMLQYMNKSTKSQHNKVAVKLVGQNDACALK